MTPVARAAAAAIGKGVAGQIISFILSIGQISLYTFPSEGIKDMVKIGYFFWCYNVFFGTTKFSYKIEALNFSIRQFTWDDPTSS